MTDTNTTPTTDSKPFWASKTLWVNAAALVATLAGIFGIESVSSFLDAEGQAYVVGIVMSVVNIVLRFLTHSSVST